MNEETKDQKAPKFLSCTGGFIVRSGFLVGIIIMVAGRFSTEAVVLGGALSLLSAVIGICAIRFAMAMENRELDDRE